jgi:hypothetical protein
MRNSLPTLSNFAVTAAAITLLTVTTYELDTARGSASERPTSSPAAHDVFRGALAAGTTVRSLDYAPPHPNCRQDPACSSS